MSHSIDKPERLTQQRVIQLFTEELNYEYLGDFTERANNGNLEGDLLGDYLKQQNYASEQISRALHQARSLAESRGQKGSGQKRSATVFLKKDQASED